MTAIKPNGAVTIARKIKRESDGGINRVLKSIIRSEWENGETATDLARRHGVTTRTISRWKAAEKWDRSNSGPDHLLDYARAEIAKKTEQTKMEVHLAIEDVIVRQKATSAILSQMLEETLARAQAYPESQPAKQLHTIKVATEIARNIQLMERKVWNLDNETQKADKTAIFDILSETTELVTLQSDDNSE
tara:strand:+ start:305 stop:877 length:573 start_codon:yes stop_codon:yes gene_type:complete